MALKKPETLEAAQAYVGTTLEKWWPATSSSAEGWYRCTVESVSDDVVEDQEGTQYSGLWLAVRQVESHIAHYHCTMLARASQKGPGPQFLWSCWACCAR
jgi:hypothetical protein